MSESTFKPGVSEQLIGMPMSELNGELAAFVRDRNRRQAYARLFGSSEQADYLGHFRLLRLIGQGGMGVVYSALDEVLNRKVAIKLVDARDDTRARLLRESQALAKLSHPNVVQIYEVGEATSPTDPADPSTDASSTRPPSPGPPLTFIVMELIDGVSLDVWLSEPHTRAELLSTFISAGRGLAAAHAAGLVHRDFKPQNVMLGSDGRIRVMDFGLARYEAELDTTLAESVNIDESQALTSKLTQERSFLGTPVYMAPEQLARETADAYSDQFGFCVALYEALYGERPFPDGSIAVLSKAVHDGQIQDPPANTTVPVWLREILIRGLAPERADRWPSMDALLDVLSDDPVLRRRKRALTLGLAVAFAAGIGGAVALAKLSAEQPCANMDAPLAGIWDVDRRAALEAAVLSTERGHAGDVWTRADASLDDYARRWVETRTSSCESTQRGEQSQLLLDRSMACLDSRFEQLRATLDQIESVDEGSLNQIMAAIARLPLLERCADADALLSEHPPPDDPELAAQVEVLDKQLDHVKVLERFGEWNQALELVTRTLEQAKTLDHGPVLARTLLQLGATQQHSAEPKSAAATLEQAYHTAVAAQLVMVAASASATLISVEGKILERPEEARRWARHAEAWSRAAGTPHAHAMYANNLGRLAMHEGEFRESQDYYEAAARSWEQELGGNHLNVAGALHNLAGAENDLGAHDDARLHAERALAIREQTLGPVHPYISQTLNTLGIIAVNVGDYEQAGVHYDRAIEVLERSLGPDHPILAFMLVNRASLFLIGDELDEAREHYARALELREAAYGPEHELVAAPLDGLGDIALDKGNIDEAEAHFQRALDIRAVALEPEHPRLALSLLGRGRVSVARGDVAGALVDLERALAVREPTTLGGLAEMRFALAEALWDAPEGKGRERERALELARLALEGYPADAPLHEDERAEIQLWLNERG